MCSIDWMIANWHESLWMVTGSNWPGESICRTNCWRVFLIKRRCNAYAPINRSSMIFVGFYASTFSHCGHISIEFHFVSRFLFYSLPLQLNSFSFQFTLILSMKIRTVGKSPNYNDSPNENVQSQRKLNLVSGSNVMSLVERVCRHAQSKTNSSIDQSWYFVMIDGGLKIAMDIDSWLLI